MHTLTVYWADSVYSIPAEHGQSLLALLTKAEITVYAPCNGRGVCRKCRVAYRSGGVTKQVLACQTTITEDAEIWISHVSGSGLTAFEKIHWPDTGSGIGAAVDIGTTTVAAALVDCGNGQVLASGAKLNPQHVCGSDVISRIAACGKGMLPLLTNLIRKTVDSLVQGLCQKHGITKPEILTVSGNTTMLHLFCGVDPMPIGIAPFVPPFTEMKVFSGNELNITANTVFALPSASGYIGSDVVCGILATQLKNSGVSLLVDLGTNGEFALYNGKQLFCTSAAVGPALEGANISCGIGGIPGAICSVAHENGIFSWKTIEDQPPIGICGSGLVDLMALLLDTGIVDEGGRFCENSSHPLAEERLRDGRFMLTDQIWLSQEDVRQFQLAKAAVIAGIITLCDYAGVCVENVENIFLTGGLGYYIPYKSALRTGLIPKCFSGKLTSVGNSSLAGAIACLLPIIREEAIEIAQAIEICNLQNTAKFSDMFLDSLCFE